MIFIFVLILIVSVVLYKNYQYKVLSTCYMEEIDSSIKDNVFLLGKKNGRLYGDLKLIIKYHENDKLISKEIIIKHDGKIWVESEEGKWINFLFTLPQT